MKKLVVNTNELKNNIEIVKSRIGDKPTKIIAVVKGNGMGLDLVKYSKFLIENGIEMLGVATYEEAITLRESGIENDILLFTPIFDKDELNNLIFKNIILTISSKEQIEIIENLDFEEVKVHIKIDTGFARYGFLYYNEQEILEAFQMCNKIKIEGIYTHFSKAIDEKSTNLQFDRFMKLLEFLKENGQDVGMKHCAESTAFIKYENMWLDAVRIGSMLQGRTLVKIDGLKKIGQFKSNIQEIKTVPKGYNISYGNMFKTKRETRIAVIPVGFLDGLNMRKDRDIFSFIENFKSVGIEFRKFFKDNQLKVTINGKKYNIIGRIGMYHCVVDITSNTDIKVRR